MAKVTYRNLLDTESEFIDINREYLLDSVREYARLQKDDEVYKSVMHEKVTIRKNNEVIHPDDWAFNDVTNSDVIIITPVLEGDKVGAIVQIVVGIVLVAVGVIFSPVLGPIAPYLIGIGIALALGGISSLIFSPDLPSMPSLGGGGGKSTQTYNWTGIRTVARADTPIPIIYGTHTVGGNIISLFTQAEGEDNYLYMLLALCEGEIYGIAQQDDLDSVCTTSVSGPTYEVPAIKLDDQGFTNYEDIEWWYRNGTNTQSVIPYFDWGSKIQYDDGRDVDENGVIYTTTSTVDAVLVTLNSASLYDGSGDDIVAKTIEYAIDIKAGLGGGGYTRVNTYSLTGKSKTGKRVSHFIDFNTSPGSGQDYYMIKISRLDGGESSDFKISNPFILEAITEGVQGVFTYPNTALLGLRIKATGQISGSPPTINITVKGRKVDVPALSGSEAFDSCYWSIDNDRWEYNGAARAWDNSTYESEYSANAMLCLRDLVLSTRYGIGNYISIADLNTNGIIAAIKECHKQDTDIGVNYHTWHGVLESEQSALTVLLEMCNSFRCWPVWYSGTINFVLDTDDTPIHTLSMGNIKSGSFSQTFVPISEIPSKLIAQFTDVDNSYNMRSIIAKTTSNTLNAINERSIGLKGITSYEVAEREVKWKLNKAINCTHIINCTCGIDYIHATAGDIINLQHQLPSWGHGGRVLSYDSSNASITIDSSYNFEYLDTHASYIIRYQDDNNDFLTATVDVSAMGGTGTYQTLNLKSHVGDSCSDAVYALGQSTIAVKPFRLLSVSRSSEDEAEISGIEHLSSLYTDPTIRVIDDNFSDLPGREKIPGPPRNVSVQSLDSTKGIGFVLKANPPDGESDILQILVTATAEDDDEYIPIATIPVSGSVGSSVEYKNNNLKLNHTYYFNFYCKTANKMSTATQTSYFLKKSDYQPPKVTGVGIKGGSPNDPYFHDKDVNLVWNAASSSIFTAEDLYGYRIEIYKGTTVSSTTFLRESVVNNEEYIYSLNNNILDTGETFGHTPLLFRIFTVAKTMTESEPASLIVINSAPSTIKGLTSLSIQGGVKFAWNTVSDLDFRTYQIRFKFEGYDWLADWMDYGSNDYSYVMTSNEIASYGNGATIVIEVRNSDWYGQYSATATSSTVTSSVTADYLKVTSILGDEEYSGVVTVGSIDTNDYGIGAGLYMAADGNYDTALADAYDTMPCVALALDAGTNGDKDLLLYGYARDDDWSFITTGSPVYVSPNTAGEFTETLCATEGELVQIVGYVIDSNTMFFDPNSAMVEIE